MQSNTEILLKRSDVPGHTPPEANLAYGELALNYADSRLFTKNAANVVVDLVIPAATADLYVALEGNDNNDGRTPARPFRTIKAALNAASPNTCVKLSAGTFYEDNPLVIPQAVTMYGSGTRGTLISPLNKDKNILYVCNAGYLTGFGFRDYVFPAIAVSFPGVVLTGNVNGYKPYTRNTVWLANGTQGHGLEDYYREMKITFISGPGAGQSANIVSYNTATQMATVDVNWGALPTENTIFEIDIPVHYRPQPYSQRYSTYITHSPYLYNLTSVTTTGTGFVVDGYKASGLKSMVCAQFTQFNQGGDGFRVTNLGYAQLVSIYAICCDTAFTATNGGTASLGNCDINFGNKGLVANGVSPIMLTATLNKPFNFDAAKSTRDAGLIIDAISFDLLYNGNSQTNFAALQFWNNTSLVGNINSQLAETANAISYVGKLSSYVVQNDTSSGIRYPTANTQDTSIPAATLTEANFIQNDFGTIVDILLNGTKNVTNKIKPNSITARSNGNIQNAYSILQANKAYIQDQGVAYVDANKPINFIYDASTCRRDIGYMVDSVSFDLLHGGNRQAIQSGVSYYGFSSANSAIANTLTQCLSSFQYLNYLLGYVVTGTPVPLPSPYQKIYTQSTNFPIGTAAEAALVENSVNYLINVVTNGPSVANSLTPIGLTANTHPPVVNAANIIAQNRDFLSNELTGYIQSYFASQTGYTISIDNLSANTSPVTELNANTKPYVGLVLNIDGDISIDTNGNISNNYFTVLSSSKDPITGHYTVAFEENQNKSFPENTAVNFFQRSSLSSSGQTFEFVGAGTDITTCLPRFGYGNIVLANQVQASNGAAVYYTSTDQFGNFSIGSDLVINFNTGTLSGRTFTRSLFAQITPFVLALENY
jgi:hypothetical protein